MLEVHVCSNLNDLNPKLTIQVSMDGLVFYESLNPRQVSEELPEFLTLLCVIVGGGSNCKFLGNKPSSSFNYYKRMT